MSKKEPKRKSKKKPKRRVTIEQAQAAGITKDQAKRMRRKTKEAKYALAYQTYFREAELDEEGNLNHSGMIIAPDGSILAFPPVEKKVQDQKADQKLLGQDKSGGDEEEKIGEIPAETAPQEPAALDIFEKKAKAFALLREVFAESIAADLSAGSRSLSPKMRADILASSVEQHAGLLLDQQNEIFAAYATSFTNFTGDKFKFLFGVTTTIEDKGQKHTVTSKLGFSIRRTFESVPIVCGSSDDTPDMFNDSSPEPETAERPATDATEEEPKLLDYSDANVVDGDVVSEASEGKQKQLEHAKAHGADQPAQEQEVG